MGYKHFEKQFIIIGIVDTFHLGLQLLFVAMKNKTGSKVLKPNQKNNKLYIKYSSLAK